MAVIEGEVLYDVSCVVPDWEQPWPPVFMQRLIADWPPVRPKVELARKTAQPIPRNRVKLRSPLPYTSNIIAAPANYGKHLDELGARGVTQAGNFARTIGFYLKATSSLTGAVTASCCPRTASVASTTRPSWR